MPHALLPTRVDRYEVLDHVTFGEVRSYLARDVRPGGVRVVALHPVVPSLSGDAAQVGRLAELVGLGVEVRHPAVLSVVDLVREGEALFVVTDLVDAAALRTVMQRARAESMALAPHVVVAILVGLLDALAATHEALARDGKARPHGAVSPATVLLGVDGVVRLLDAGAAMVAEAALGADAPHVVAYKAPEQKRGQVGVPSSDLFAVGVIGWELLTGAPLFLGADADETRRRVEQLLVQPPSRVRPALPKKLDSVLLRSLARATGVRFPTARAMADALQQAVEPATFAELAELASRTRGDSTAPMPVATTERVEAVLSQLREEDPNRAAPSGRVRDDLSRTVERPAADVAASIEALSRSGELAAALGHDDRARPEPPQGRVTSGGLFRPSSVPPPRSTPPPPRAASPSGAPSPSARALDELDLDLAPPRVPSQRSLRASTPPPPQASLIAAVPLPVAAPSRESMAPPPPPAEGEPVLAAGAASSDAPAPSAPSTPPPAADDDGDVRAAPLVLPLAGPTASRARFSSALLVALAVLAVLAYVAFTASGR